MQLRSGLAALVSLTALTVPASATASAAGLVRIGAIANPPSTLAPGASFRERFTVTRGRTAPRAATLDFYFSRSVTAKPATGITLGHASLTALRRKRSITAVARLTVPRRVRSASRYYLLGCVRSAHPAAARGAAKTVCRAARRRVTIAAASRGDGTFPSSIPTSLPGIRPKPRSVTPHLDNAHATTVTVTPDTGGTLSTTGADGTRYRLDVTKGAVLSPLQVTMTPLSSIERLGMSGGLVGGVQVSPDGLQLLEPARLTIVPRAGAPTANPTAFVYEGNGSNLGLVPPHPGSGVSFELTHFSGGGVGSATNADRSAQDGHAPAGTAEQFRQEAQRLSQAGDRNGVLHLFNTYYTQILKPKLEAALEDETLAPAATVEALAAVRQMEILGYDVSGTRAAIMHLIIEILKNAFNRAYDRCVSDHNPAEVQNLVADLRALALRGAAGEVDASKVGKCVQFKLDYTADLTDNANGSTIQGENLGVESLQAPLSYDSTTGADEGDLPLTITHITDYNQLCVAQGDTGLARATAPGHAAVTIEPNVKSEQRGAHTIIAYGPPTIRLVLDRGAIDVAPAGCGANYLHDNNYALDFWRNIWPDLEGSNSHGGPLTFEPSNWIFLGGSAYATTSMPARDHVGPGSDYSGSVHLTLHHTPGG